MSGLTGFVAAGCKSDGRMLFEVLSQLDELSMRYFDVFTQFSIAGSAGEDIKRKL